MRSTLLALAPLIIVLCEPGDVVAQPATAQAEHLFREGKRLMSEGNIAAACEAFEGSLAKDPAVSTLLNLAACREKNQQYASAWAHFVEAARQTRSDPDSAAAHKSAQDRAAAVESRLSYLIINVPDEARVDGLTITRNGVPVEAVEWNRDIPVDGGKYQIEGKAPAFEAWSTTVNVGNAKDKQSVNVPRFREALAVAEPEPSAPTHATTPRRSSFTGKRKVATALWAVGAIAIGSGLALEVASRGTYDAAKAATDNTERHELTDSANRQRGFATAAAAAGVVAVGVGVFLWVSGRPADHGGLAVAPHFDAERAGLVLVGRF